MKELRDYVYRCLEEDVNTWNEKKIREEFNKQYMEVYPKSLEGLKEEYLFLEKLFIDVSDEKALLEAYPDYNIEKFISLNEKDYT